MKPVIDLTDSYNDGIAQDKSALIEANDAGWNAYARGDSIDDNPYPIDSAVWHEWRAGFEEAYEDD